jgi:glycosyltransferase involved in cell wall biosynthesis
MKILYVNTAMATWGGIERVLVEKMNYLSEQYGYEICLVTADQGNHPIHYPLNRNIVYQDLGINFHQQYHFKGIRRIIKELKLNRLFVERLRCLILESPPDIIVSIRSNLTNNIVKAKGNIPLVFESHSSCLAQFVVHPGLFSRLKVLYLNYSAKYADQVVALTKGDSKEWLKINSNVCVIPNIVHLNETGLYSNCEAKSVIFVGRYSKQKDISSLLQIWSIVQKVHPDWVLHIYGGYGGEQERLLPKICNNDNIIIHNPTLNMIEKYLGCSMLLLTSLFEPFGLVLPEAMSCGLPVVAFDCPYGPADIITDGVDGFLIKKRDIKDYAEKVCLLMDDLSMRKKMGQAGIVSSQRFSAERIMPKWKEFFEHILYDKEKK